MIEFTIYCDFQGKQRFDMDAPSGPFGTKVSIVWYVTTKEINELGFILIFIAGSTCCNSVLL